MSSSPSHPPPVRPRGTVRPLWSLHTSARPRGLALAREKGWVLAWDENDWLYLLNRAGQRQGQVRTPAPLTAACAADDGHAFATGGKRGQVWWLAPDLSIRWEKPVPDRPTALALDPFGQYLAVADARANLVLFNRDGKVLSRVVSPRPFHHLAFVPAAPYLVGASDFGLVACLDLKGRWVWRDGLVVHIGGLSVSGAGEQILLACFTEGLRRYSVAGRGEGRVPVAEACRLVSQTFDGKKILAAGLNDRLLLLDRDGRTLHAHALDRPVAALALSALGETAVAALADGTVTGLDLRELR